MPFDRDFSFEQIEDAISNLAMDDIDQDETELLLVDINTVCANHDIDSVILACLGVMLSAVNAKEIAQWEIENNVVLMRTHATSSLEN